MRRGSGSFSSARINEFRRRAQKSGAERIRRHQPERGCLGETEPGAKRSVHLDLGNRDGDGEHAYNSREALPTLFGSVAAGIHNNGSLEDDLHLTGPTPAGLRQKRAERLGAGHLARLTTEGPRPQSFRPGVQCRVCRCPLAMQQEPGHPT